MASTAIGTTDALRQMTFGDSAALYNAVWGRIPPEKRTLYECAHSVICAANVAFPEPPEELTDVGKTYWRAGHAHRLISAVDSMTDWAKSTEGRTVYVVQTISDWFGKHGWTCLQAPLRDLLLTAKLLHNAGLAMEQESKRARSQGTAR